MTDSARLYAELDTITGGLPEFLAAQRDETWQLGGYKPFNLTALGEQHVLFGFRVQINGDSCPDPQIKVRIDLADRTAQVITAELLLGSWQHPNIPAGTDQYAIDLLSEMQQRRLNPAMRRRVYEPNELEAA